MKQVKQVGALSVARKLSRILAFSLILFLILSGVLARFITDSQWFGSLGQGAVFTTQVKTQIMLFMVFALGFFGLTYVNAWVALRTRQASGEPTWVLRGQNVTIDPVKAAAMIDKAVRALLFGIPLAIAFLMAVTASQHWQTYLQFTHATPFGNQDPVFHKDISFYVFRMPFLSFLQGMAVTGCGLALALTAAAYFSGGARQEAPRNRNLHLAVLAALLLSSVAWGVWLGRYNVLYSDHGTFIGAGYTDVHARIPVATLQVIFLIATGFACLLSSRSKRPWLIPGLGLAGYFVLSLLGGAIYPSLVQRFTVVPNQLGAESPYIARDLEMTRQAYGLDKVEVRTGSATRKADAATLQTNKTSIDSIRLWDWPQLGAVYAAKEGLRKYYSFVIPEHIKPSGAEYNIDVDRYTLNGKPQQVMLAARELNLDGLAEEARTWQNLRLQYTHGYGMVASPVNEVDPDGLPTYLAHQIPIRTEYSELKVDRPQIYFGELTNDYSFVNTKLEELDYPDEGGNRTTRYSGQGGTPLGGSLNRLWWSIRLRDTNMLFSNELTAESRVLFQRDVRSRTKALAPYLLWDDDPYLVVSEGRLKWIVDAYTSTSRYPYSRPRVIGYSRSEAERLNYIRNSVKAVVDAYDGDVTLYMFDESDPLIKTYQRIYPTLYKAGSTMPEGLRAHVRYPETLFRIQREVYTRYHMTDPRDYYQQEDLWAVPADPTPNGSNEGYGGEQMSPYYVSMQLPGEAQSEFLLMTPYTPRATQNISAWLCARCDGDGYGQLVAYRYPKGSTINGPQQIIGQIKQNRDVSQFQTLLGQRGSRVIFGNLLAIPMQDSLLYAVPVYVQASDVGAAAIPEISQVILATGDRIVMRSTLPEAVKALAGEDSARPVPDKDTKPTETGPTVSGKPLLGGSPLDRASEAYRRARQRQREYDKALDDLGVALEDLKRVQSPPKL